MTLRGILAALLATVAALAFTACSLFEDMGRSHHEGNSTSLIVDVPVEKLPEAISKGGQKAGYMLNKVKESPIDGEFESSNLNVTYKKIDDKKSKIYVRVGSFGEKDKEALIVNEIKKELGVK